jgi:hypothetical protein
VGNAIWLILALPKWFFPAVLAPLAAGPLTLIPATGTACLVVGIVLGAIKRKVSLFLFLIPAMLSELLVGVAGFFRGRMQGSPTDWLLGAFLILQVLLCGYLVWRARGARAAAAPLAIFCVSYATFAAFVAAMAFNDTWL